ncbi:MAG TPA: hypothetical protein VHU83_14995 [Bryobacteraceae bacterium]|nr:hypothetical protein [Bryobacteraceae bacterium]
MSVGASALLALAAHARVFLSPDSPLGFGLSDWMELGAAALIVALLIVTSSLRAPAMKFAQRTGWCMLLLFALPIALRLALLARSPAPVASGADDFSYMLLADTLRHFRLANPPHALAQFFEQIFVLQQPTYSSMYPLGQGLCLALGWILFGHPWAGVLLSAGALCALCYWMLRAWTTPGWALIGGLLAAMEFGPLCYWMNCYWGGAVSAIAGCLVFGSLPRLVEQRRRFDAVLLGLGLALQLLTRPFEFFLLLASALLFLIPALFRNRGVLRLLAVSTAILCAAGGIVLAQNKAVTHSWTMLPYMLYRYQYGIPATFTFQPNPIPHRPLNSEQELDYKAETAIHGDAGDTLASYFSRLFFRIRFYRFFFWAPLYLAALAFPAALRQWRFAWVAVTLLLFALCTNFFPYFYPHYIAAVTCLFVLASVAGLERLNRIRLLHVEAGTVVLCLCAAQFLFWYGAHADGNEDALGASSRYETWDYLNYGDPQGRIRIDEQLARLPGKQLVFVRYGPRHMFQEWVHNASDIDGARTVWAHDLGAENEKLLRYYPDRSAWLLEPDTNPPNLVPYARDAAPFQQVQ